MLYFVKTESGSYLNLNLIEEIIVEEPMDEVGQWNVRFIGTRPDDPYVSYSRKWFERVVLPRLEAYEVQRMASSAF